MAIWTNFDPGGTFDTPIKVNYTEYIARQGQEGWELAFANNASSAYRQWNVDIEHDPDTGEVEPDPDARMFTLFRNIRGIVGYPQVLATGWPGRLSWTDPPVAYINRIRPLNFPLLYRQVQGVAYPPGISSQTLPFLHCTRIESIRGIDWQDKTDHDPNANPLGLWASPLDDFNDISIFGLVRLRMYFEALPYYILEDTNALVRKQILVPSTGEPTGFFYPDESTCARYVTRLGQPNADYINLMNGLMKFAEGDLSIPGPIGHGPVYVPYTVGKILSYIDVIFRWEQVPEEAIASRAINPLLQPLFFQTAIDYCLGKVNDRPFPTLPNQDLNFPGTGGFPAGTLLMLAVKFTPFMAPSGRRLYTVDFMFKYFEPGHHKIYGWKGSNPDGTKANDLDFVEISTDGQRYPIGDPTEQGKHVYQAAFFDQMFWPPLPPP